MIQTPTETAWEIHLIGLLLIRNIASLVFPSVRKFQVFFLSSSERGCEISADRRLRD